jgi:hypothetical protein
MQIRTDKAINSLTDALLVKGNCFADYRPKAMLRAMLQGETSVELENKELWNLRVSISWNFL